MPSSLSLAGLLAAVAAVALPVINAQSCNGYAELCSRTYSNVTHMGTHNSYSVQINSLAANQHYDVTTQLNNGIRMLQNQAHLENGVIHLCHSSCLLLDAGPVTSYLAKVKTWMDANPNEVVTILWVNSDTAPMSLWKQAYQAAGLESYAYVPLSTPVVSSAWPTLQSLISSGKRLVSFVDYGADYSACSYILDHFSHFWETPYDETNIAFPCNVDRGSASTNIYMMNHFFNKNLSFFGSQIPVPDTAALNRTNAISGTGSLGLQASQCASQHGRYPTFVLVDYYDVPTDGSVFQVAAMLNSVTYAPRQIGNGTVIAGFGSSTTSTSNGNNAGANGSSKPNSAASFMPTALITQMAVPVLLLLAAVTVA